MNDFIFASKVDKIKTSDLVKKNILGLRFFPTVRDGCPSGPLVFGIQQRLVERLLPYAQRLPCIEQLAITGRKFMASGTRLRTNTDSALHWAGSYRNGTLRP